MIYFDPFDVSLCSNILDNTLQCILYLRVGRMYLNKNKEIQEKPLLFIYNGTS